MFHDQIESLSRFIIFQFLYISPYAKIEVQTFYCASSQVFRAVVYLKVISDTVEISNVAIKIGPLWCPSAI